MFQKSHVCTQEARDFRYTQGGNRPLIRAVILFYETTSVITILIFVNSIFK